MQWVVLARILRPQGRKGEVLADLLTDFPERFRERPRVWLVPEGFSTAPADAPGEPVEATVVSHWLPVGRNVGRIVLHFAGVDTIEKAEKLAGQEVVVPLSERVRLTEGAYVSDLADCTVYDRDVPLGRVSEVQFPTTADGSRRLDDAAPLLTVATPTGGEVLVPFAKAYLLELDLAGKAIRMALPEGLVDLNEAANPQTKST